jgi:predicted Ser/Thr protein kinase
MTDMETDSLIRAVAAAPHVAPPVALATVIAVRVPSAAERARVQTMLGELSSSFEELGEDIVAAVVVSSDGERDAVLRAATCGKALASDAPGVRVAVATDRADTPAAVQRLHDRARRMLDAQEDSPSLRLDERTTLLVADASELRVTAAAPAALPASDVVDRAIRDEQFVNMRRLFTILIVLLVLAMTNALFLASMGASEQRWVAPLIGVWLVLATARVVVLHVHPATSRWMAYSVFLVEIPFEFICQYPALVGTQYPGELAAYTVAAGVLAVATMQLFMSSRLVIAVGFCMSVGSAGFLAVAGRAEPIGGVFLLLGAMVVISIYGQSRMKTLLRRIAAETETRAREAEAANVELRRQVASRSRELADALSRLASAPVHASRFAAGDVIEQRYRVIRSLGAGGMGQVYEVERVTDGKRLALKVSTRVADREALARFAREAQIAAELHHASIVAVVDVGITASGTMFIVMELVPGASLAATCDRFGDVAWAIAVLRQIASALAAMHARGIVHRDLKPANVLVDGDRVKVADFGLAGLIDAAPLASTFELGEASPSLTRTGAIMGTPMYMAPELVRGTGAAGASADVFSLGVLAYELLSGSLPHAAPPVLDRLAGRVPAPPAPLAIAGLPAGVAAVLERCLALEPDARPSADAVARALGG